MHDLVGEGAVELGEVVERRLVGGQALAQRAQLGVDRLLDMCRTTLNVAGDLTIAAIVSRGEEEAVAAPLPETKPGEPFLEKQA